MAILISVIVLVACSSRAQSQELSATNLHKQIVGTWWSDDRWLGAPFSLVTFYDDGRYTRTNTNITVLAGNGGYWRVAGTNEVILTPQRNAMPTDPIQVFQVDHITDHNMVFTERVDKFSIHFVKR